MARFNYGGLVSGGTGRLLSQLGGLVLSKNGVVRGYTTPVNPRTTDQVNVRAVFTTNTQAWNALSEAQRIAWNAAAGSGAWVKTDPFTGTTRNIASGKLLYMFVNQNILQVGGTVVSSVPTLAALGNTVATAATIAAAAGTFTVTYTGTVGTNERHVFTSTPTVNAGVMRMRKAISRLITFNTTASPATIATPYTTQFGTLTGTAGKKVFTLVEAINSVTGQRRLVGIVSGVIAA